MKLYLIRHSQSGKNKNFDQLTNIGIEQSRRLGSYFINKKIDIVYCSPQKRTRKTLKIIKPYLERNIQIKFSEQVRQQAVPEEVGQEVLKKLKIKIDTDYELDKRVQTFLEYLMNYYTENNILILTHQKFILSAVCRLLNLPPTEKQFMNKIHNASVTYFELNKKLKVNKYSIGDITHLVKYAPGYILKAQKSKETAYPISVAVTKINNTEEIKWIKRNYPVEEIKKSRNYNYYEIKF